MNAKQRIILDYCQQVGEPVTAKDIILAKFPTKQQPHINPDINILVSQGKLIRDDSTYPYTIRIPKQGEKIPHPKDYSRGKNSASTNINLLEEEQIKELLYEWLKENGWNAEVAWGKQHGADIVAVRNNEKWIIEVKGCGTLNAMRVNYFLSILGETLQRMDDATAKYSVALPDLQQYRNLWNRLPALAKERTQISAIFISANGEMLFTD